MKIVSRVYNSYRRRRICVYFICTHTYTHTHTHTHTHIHTYMHTCTHTHLHAHIHAHIHTYIHTHIHTYIHTYQWWQRMVSFLGYDIRYENFSHSHSSDYNSEKQL